MITTKLYYKVSNTKKIKFSQVPGNGRIRESKRGTVAGGRGQLQRSRASQEQGPQADQKVQNNGSQQSEDVSGRNQGREQPKQTHPRSYLTQGKKKP